jgi:hypothetical protein
MNNPYQPKPSYREEYEVEEEILDEEGKRFPYTPMKLRIKKHEDKNI